MSHTFILREVAALRVLGFEVLTCSIRRTGNQHLQGPEERDAAKSTFYVLDAAKNPLVLLSAHIRALRHPGRYLSALTLALQTARPGLRGLLYSLFYFAEAGVLARHLQSSKVTHLHNHFADSSANVSMLSAALADIPFSYTLHGPAELFEPRSWHLATKTRRAAFVACISHFARSQAMLFSDPGDWTKLKIVHCGVEPERYQSRNPDGPTGPHLIFVGRLTAIKGVRVLLAAISKVREDFPSLRLTLIGDGADRAHLETLAEPFGEAVTFAGFQSQDGVAASLASADIFVLPSFAEGVPVVLMEAMASGKPVIATRVAGVPELVEDGVSGLLVSPGDADALADALRRLAADPALRARMGEAGRRKVRAEFDIGTEAARIGALFLDQGGAGPRPEPLSPKAG